jgi:hypothetical protein
MNFRDISVVTNSRKRRLNPSSYRLFKAHLEGRVSLSDAAEKGKNRTIDGTEESTRCRFARVFAAGITREKEKGLTIEFVSP